MFKMLKQARWFLLVIVSVLVLSGCGEDVDRKETTTPSLPAAMSDFPNAYLLVAGDSLQNVLGNSDVIIIDARTSGYSSAHIPGAISVLHSDYWTAASGLKDLATLETQLGAAGISRDSQIVIYDDTTASWGAAGRIFWMLEYLGCTDVRILNGGWDKWLADGRPTQSGTKTRAPSEFIAEIKPWVKASKEHIAGRLGDSDFATVDTRTDEEYNGWILYSEARGGHIPGAVQLPYAWYYNTDKTVLSYSALMEMFESHGITPDKEVVSYCTAGIRSGFFYFLGRLMGYEQLANYDASIWDWAAADETTYPLEKLEEYQDLVYPAWVQALINYHAPGSTSAAPADYAYGRDHKYLIFETQWGSFDDMAMGWADTSYLQGHIPGAIHSNSDTYENGYPRWFMLPDDELHAAVGSMGITADTTVVVYSNSPIFATRLWWILKYAGVEDVRLLNGGYEAWTAAGYDGETIINEPVPTTFVGTVHPELVATTDYVAVNYNTGDTILADVRTYPEYAGEVSGYGYVVNKGRIPGAIYAFNADNPDRDYLDNDGTVRSFTEVQDMWQGLGIESTLVGGQFDKDVIFYCGSGYRSSLSFFYAYLMGYQNVRNYSDGWEGWSTNYVEDPSYSDPDLPGSTDGWRQDPSGRPVSYGVHPEWDFDGYSNLGRLVNAKWVNDVLLQNDNFGNPYVIAEVNWGPAGESYTNGHIPGAIHVNTDEIEYDCFNARNDWPVDAGSPACWDRSTTVEEDAAKGLGPEDSLPRNWWNIYPDEYLLPGIAYMGIDKNTTVVVYGPDATAAARLAWTLLYAGVEDVRLMEGGYDAWVNAGYDGSTATVTRTPVAEFDPDMPGRTTAINAEYKVDIPYVRDVVNGIITDALLVDIRSYDEYIGLTAPYSYIPTSGRIPGAAWGKAGTSPWTMEDYVTADNTLKAPSEIETFWTAEGITSADHLSFYCGTSWRSSLAWFYGYMMGYPQVSNFDSSWFEWSMGEGSAYAGASPVLNPIVDEYPADP